uniref:De novo designed protein K12 n=1 Tax=synthetic construct TaxID=32630 RepID=UPI003704D51A
MSGAVYFLLLDLRAEVDEEIAWARRLGLDDLVAALEAVRALIEGALATLESADFDYLEFTQRLADALSSLVRVYDDLIARLEEQPATTLRRAYRILLEYRRKEVRELLEAVQELRDVLETLERLSRRLGRPDFAGWLVSFVLDHYGELVAPDILTNPAKGFRALAHLLRAFLYVLLALKLRSPDEELREEARRAVAFLYGEEFVKAHSDEELAELLLERAREAILEAARYNSALREEFDAAGGPEGREAWLERQLLRLRGLVERFLELWENSELRAGPDGELVAVPGVKGLEIIKKLLEEGKGVNLALWTLGRLLRALDLSPEARAAYEAALEALRRARLQLQYVQSERYEGSDRERAEAIRAAFETIRAAAETIRAVIEADTSLPAELKAAYIEVIYAYLLQVAREVRDALWRLAEEILPEYIEKFFKGSEEEQRLTLYELLRALGEDYFFLDLEKEGYSEEELRELFRNAKLEVINADESGKIKLYNLILDAKKLNRKVLIKITLTELSEGSYIITIEVFKSPDAEIPEYEIRVAAVGATSEEILKYLEELKEKAKEGELIRELLLLYVDRQIAELEEKVANADKIDPVVARLAIEEARARGEELTEADVIEGTRAGYQAALDVLRRIKAELEKEKSPENPFYQFYDKLTEKLKEKGFVSEEEAFEIARETFGFPADLPPLAAAALRDFASTVLTILEIFKTAEDFSKWYKENKEKLIELAGLSEEELDKIVRKTLTLLLEALARSVFGSKLGRELLNEALGTFIKELLESFFRTHYGLTRGDAVIDFDAKTGILSLRFTPRAYARIRVKEYRDPSLGEKFDNLLDVLSSNPSLKGQVDRLRVSYAFGTPVGTTPALRDATAEDLETDPRLKRHRDFIEEVENLYAELLIRLEEALKDEPETVEILTEIIGRHLKEVIHDPDVINALLDRRDLSPEEFAARARAVLDEIIAEEKKLQEKLLEAVEDNPEAKKIVEEIFPKIIATIERYREWPERELAGLPLGGSHHHHHH